MSDDSNRHLGASAEHGAYVAALEKRLALVTAYEEGLRAMLQAAHARITESDELVLRLRGEAQNRETALAHATAALRDRDEGIRWLRAEAERAAEHIRAIRQDAEGRAADQAREIATQEDRFRTALEDSERRAAEHLRVIAARDDGIAWLRAELALASRSKLRTAWETALRVARGALHALLRSPTALAPAEERLSSSPAVELAVDDADWVLLPEISAGARKRLLDLPLPTDPRRRPDVVCFSIIDWDFRYQRPQQLLAQFAEHGHRVFWISPTETLPADATPRFSQRWIRPNLCEVKLAATRTPNVYGEQIPADDRFGLLASLEALRRELGIDEAIALVGIASWADLALAARHRFGWSVVYDCMDEWAHFEGIGRAVVEAESSLVAEADLVVVSAERLRQKWQGRARRLVLARNGADVAFYRRELGPSSILDGISGPIIGYFGAIADWFDVDLVAEVAARRPAYSFVLVGGIFAVDVSALRRLGNVHLFGQRPYAEMPKFLHGFDVCLIPFKRNAVTHATDPVKYYEYLCAGKPVVAVALDELEPYREDHYRAETADDFVRELDRAVAENDPELALRRQRFAGENRWEDRYAAVRDALPRRPRASVVVITYENLALTRLCLESVLRNTAHADYELVIVDNASQDGTPAYLRHLAERYDHVAVIANADNRGFPRAVNQGLERSAGEHLVILNNDVVVPPGWLSVLVRHLGDPEIGMVGPTTNFAGNEAKIEVPYRTIAEMERFAAARRRSEDGRIADITVLAMFCVAFRRDVFAAVGPLDEGFGIGMFEDDDYSIRVRKAGFRVVCAADAFVHHVGQAAFKDLIAAGTYDPLFNQNRARFEAKWEKPWVAHRVVPLDFRRGRRAER